MTTDPDELTSAELLEEEGDPLLGIYLSPPRILSPYSFDNPFDGLIVDYEIPVGPYVVLLSKAGGLFVRVPEVLPAYLQPVLDQMPGDPDPKWQMVYRRSAFQAEAARLFNVVLCELAFEGIVSAPASSVQLGYGYLVRGTHAVLSMGGGGRESYFDRGIHASSVVMHGSPHMWHGVMHDHDLPRVPELRRAGPLAKLSPALPELIVGAYANLSRQHLAEAIVDSWVVTEQILDAYWEAHIAGATDPGRAAALRDGRTYTAAVRGEVLLTAGRITSNLWQSVTAARGHRNKLAHRAEVTEIAAQETADAMHDVLEAWLGESIADLQTHAYPRPSPPRPKATRPRGPRSAA